jgi:hypothetical protein
MKQAIKEYAITIVAGILMAPLFVLGVEVVTSMGKQAMAKPPAGRLIVFPPNSHLFAGMYDEVNSEPVKSLSLEWDMWSRKIVVVDKNKED